MENKKTVCHKGDREFLSCMGKLACFLYNYMVQQNKGHEFVNEFMHAYIPSDEHEYMPATILQEELVKMRKTPAYLTIKKATFKMRIEWEKMDIVLLLVEEMLDMIKTQVGVHGKITSKELRMQLMAYDFQDLFIIWFLWNHIV